MKRQRLHVKNLQYTLKEHFQTPLILQKYFFLQVNLLNKVLGIVAGVLLIDHDVRATEFQQVPYHRIFIMLFLELNAPEQILETINFQVLTAYSNMLSILRPAKVKLILNFKSVLMVYC